MSVLSDSFDAVKEGESINERSTYAIVEFGKEFGVEEQIGGCGKFVCDGVEEDFGAVVFVLLVGALFRFHGLQPQTDDVRAIA